MTRLITYNLNGIRSAMNKDWAKWLKAVAPDIVCLQELKATPDQVDLQVFTDLGYSVHWFPAVKKGYSGVAIFTKPKPSHVEYGMGIKKYDDEGRVIRADYGEVSVMSVYMPSGSSGEDRQAFKIVWLKDFMNYIKDLKKQRKKLIISGDFNICHKPIDIHNPVSNKNTSGFLPEEREWMDAFMSEGFYDTFRQFNQEPHQYSWWSFRFNARARNLGWRIDYHMATENLKDSFNRSVILPEAKHSDHCPVLLEAKPGIFSSIE
ncbi:MAG: exodeoxyribonuclease III [Flavobacteriales bacterium]